MLRKMSGLVSEFTGLHIKQGLKASTKSTDDGTVGLHQEGNSADEKAQDKGQLQPVTKAVTVDSDTGEVMVRKLTGKVKIRRGQSVEEYQEQLRQYFLEENGPTRTVEGALRLEDFKVLLDDNALDLSLKQVRQRMISYAQSFYYERKYDACIMASEQLLAKFEPYNKKNKLIRELDELKYMIEKSNSKSSV